MKRIPSLVVALLVPVLLGCFAPQAVAQEGKSARGTVTAMAADTLTVKVGTTEMKFTVDPKTEVIARGAGTMSRRAEAAGTPGPRLADIVKVGNAVLVDFHEMGTMNHASRIQVISSAGPAGGSVSGASKNANGTVKAVAANTLTVTADGKDLTFAIDDDTNVVGRGVGTAASAAGGRVPIAQVVKAGDRVTVTYHEMGNAMHAAEVRISGTGRQ
jgi:hypothetical protein